MPVVLGMYWRRGSTAGALAAIVGGSITGLAGGLGWLDSLSLPIVSGFPTIVNGALVSLVLYVAVSLLLPQSDDPAPLAEGPLSYAAGGPAGQRVQSVPGPVSISVL